MNTTALRSTVALGRNPGTTTGAAKEALRATARDFVASLLNVTKSTLLSQQPTRPRLRRF